MEKALVVSGVGALLEIVAEGDGPHVPPGGPDRLADVIEELLDDPGRAARLGAAAREWVVANRTWAQNGRRYLELYRRLGVV